MKKSISSIIAFSLLLSQFSILAQMPQEQVQQNLDEIEANYQKQLKVLQSEREQQLFALREQYEFELEVIDAQLRDAKQNITSEY